MISNELSQNIYNQLINGKTINKQNYAIKTNELDENPLYNELFTNFDEYYKLYQRINFDLIHKNASFFFIRGLGSKDANEATIKIQVLLIVIGRIITEQGFLFDTLTDYRAGIRLEDLSVAITDERYTDILHTCKLCIKGKSIESEIEDNLVARGIIYKNSRGYYVLTNAGKAFFDDLKDAFKVAEELQSWSSILN